MAHDGVNGKPTGADFLLEEYKGLLELNKAREERFDRLITLFMSLAGAPWVLYGFIVKNDADFSVTRMPTLVGAVFFGAGFLGMLVAMMAIQTRFTVTMYARATNSIRGHFAKPDAIARALRLPTAPHRPHYVEGGNYNTLAVLAMALVNATYFAFGLYRISESRVPQAFRMAVVAWILWLVGHFCYYFYQASERERKDSGAEVDFDKKSRLVQWLNSLSNVFLKRKRRS